MADIGITKFRVQIPRSGSIPSTPGFAESEGQDPINPPGSPTGVYVPYSGATGSVNLGEFGLSTGYVTFDTTPTGTPTTQGTTYWDDSKSTVALVMNGTTQHIGQDTFYYVKNSSGSPIPKGTCVRFAGTDGGSGHLLIEPFLANGTYSSNVFMGVTAETIANGSFGQVMHFGELDGINTNAYTAGDLLYASTTVAGGFQTTVPVAPNNIVLVAAAINSKNNGTIAVRPTYGSNINQDEGVKITSPTTGQTLVYNSISGLWENQTLSGSKWTDVGSDIYRNSAVAIGRTTIPTNATFAVQSLTTSGTDQFFQLLNNSGNKLVSLTQNGDFGINTDATSDIKFAVRAPSDTTTGAAIRAFNLSNTLTFELTGSTLRSLVVTGINRIPETDVALGVQANPSQTIAIRLYNNSGTRTADILGSTGSYQSLGGAFFGSSNTGIAPTARVDIRGAGTGTGITLLLEDSTGANKFEFLDNGNLSIPSTNGAKIGTATSQKIGFWNATPIVQPTTTIAESAFVENAGGVVVNDDSTFDGYTLRQIVKALRDAGLLA